MDGAGWVLPNDRDTGKRTCAASTGLQELRDALSVADVRAARDTDAAWRDFGIRVRKERPPYADSYVRMFRCGVRTAVR